MKHKLAMLCFVMLSFVTTAFAADNSIYIDQSGSNATVSIIQNGAGNIVEGVQGTGTSSTTPATIYGNNNQVTVNQVGSGDTLSFGIRTSVVNGVTGGNSYTYNITGNNSQAVIDSNNDGTGTSGSNSVTINQTGNTENTNVNVLGTQNSVTATTTGGNGDTIVSTINGNSNSQSINISGGDSNSLTINQGIGGSALPSGSTATVSGNGSATVTIVGASNTVGITQTSAGYSNTAVVSLDGSGNTASITQNASAGNTTVNLHSVGSNNAFTVNTNAH
jgi:trimeric autotransporter adhesin